ncbi:MAG TPA: PilZ domain-containing protein [Novosphingobium sp.]|nr:PilZ domain-containing protein [Novosphingobium sp.]
MIEGDNRQIPRDSLFLLADLRVDGLPGDHRIKVRNLSARGMMGEGAVHVSRGAVVSVDIRNVGWVRGTVAWVQDNRFGVAFADEIDARLARAPIIAGEDPAPHYVRPRPEPAPKDGPFRKI